MSNNHNHRSAVNSAASFLLTLNPGTLVAFQYDGGGLGGLWRGNFQGVDTLGNALFTNVVNANGTTTISGITRVRLNTINSVSL
ncbi:hypothetical protein [Paenibacillus protaetiae]|uniref:Uncharacterized protein n=1 Tax=Paenibacillus protaetiae TaxID=2509456 RepID=A0A4V0YFM4_9BACL|nr:hypothetical protein [Paenibacillus protaetiae]QAY68221.1 hypothetical protein ET464_19420 [Paenibacillus protaetiae]